MKKKKVSVPVAQDAPEKKAITADDVGIEVRFVGGIALAKAMTEAMGIQRTVDLHCPPDGRNNISHGQAIEMLVVNVLTNPEALYHVEDWAKKSGIREAYGIEPEYLNDDRLASALDAIHPYLQMIKSEIALSVCKRFAIPLKFLHWDLTHITFTGEYENQSPEFVNIVYSRKNNQSPVMKCVKVGMNVEVSNGCGVPVWYDLLDGKEGECKATIRNMENLKKHMKPDTLVRISDKGCFSAEVLSLTREEGFHIIAPETFTTHYRELYRTALEKGASWSALSYLSQREQKKKNDGESYDGYQGFETASKIRFKDKCYPVRVVFVHSDGKDKREKKSREKHRGKIEGTLEKCRGYLGSVHYRNAVEATESIRKKLKGIPEAKYLSFSVTGEKREMTLEYQWDNQALKDAEIFDVVYPLIVTLPEKKNSMDSVFTHYKEQHFIEQCNKYMKRPLRVRPIYVHKQERVESLVFVFFMAVMAYCLMMRNLKKLSKTDPTLKHLTPRRLFFIFANIAFVRLIIAGQLIVKLTPLDFQQKSILEALGVRIHFY